MPANSTRFWPLDRNRASEYRERAAEARLKAEALSDAHARKVMVKAADTWDRMADYEERKIPQGQHDGYGVKVPSSTYRSE